MSATVLLLSQYVDSSEVWWVHFARVWRRTQAETKLMRRSVEAEGQTPLSTIRYNGSTSRGGMAWRVQYAVRCAVVCCGALWCGVMWCGVVRCGAARCREVRVV
eukprot:scaffold57_cov254-Pinguiococcus_pyrenoidosus.AAC.18